MMDEKVIKSALVEANELLINTYEDGEYTFKGRVERNIKRIFFREIHPLICYLNKIAAMVVLALLLGGTIVLATSETARAAVLGWFNEIVGETATYKGQYDSHSDIKEYTIKSLVPKGYDFSLNDSYISEEEVCEAYTDSEGYYLYMDVANAAEGKNVTFFLDEGDEVEKVTVCGRSVDHYYDAEDTGNAYVWQNEQGTLFYIGGRISNKDLNNLVEKFIQKYK